jgi:hypothetical protein
LIDREHFQLRATHPLFNRRLWSLEVVGDSALLVDYHQKRVCRYGSEAELAALPIGPLPFSRLPALLLGLIPGQPGSEPVLQQEGATAFEDRYGRQWRALIRNDRVEEWTVLGTDGSSANWRPSEGWLQLLAPRDETRLRWKTTALESMTAPPTALKTPERYEEGPCDLGWLEGVSDASWQ